MLMCRLTGGGPPLQQPAHSKACCVSLHTLSGRATIITAVHQADTFVLKDLFLFVYAYI